MFRDGIAEIQRFVHQPQHIEADRHYFTHCRQSTLIPLWLLRSALMVDRDGLIDLRTIHALLSAVLGTNNWTDTRLTFSRIALDSHCEVRDSPRLSVHHRSTRRILKNSNTNLSKVVVGPKLASFIYYLQQDHLQTYRADNHTRFLWRTVPGTWHWSKTMQPNR